MNVTSPPTWLESALSYCAASLFHPLLSSTKLQGACSLLPIDDIYIPGIAPRKAHKAGNSCVFTSTEAPPHLPILPHTEMTYWPSAPDVLMFQCQQLESVDIDSGETVLFDTRKAARELGLRGV